MRGGGVAFCVSLHAHAAGALVGIQRVGANRDKVGCKSDLFEAVQGVDQQPGRSADAQRAVVALVLRCGGFETGQALFHRGFARHEARVHGFEFSTLRPSAMFESPGWPRE